MDIGSGIAISGGVIGIVMALRVFKKGSNSVVTQNQFNFFVETVLKDFVEVKEGITGIHKRIDKILESR